MNRIRGFKVKGNSWIFDPVLERAQFLERLDRPKVMRPNDRGSLLDQTPVNQLYQMDDSIVPDVGIMDRIVDMFIRWEIKEREFREQCKIAREEEL